MRAAALIPVKTSRLVASALFLIFAPMATATSTLTLRLTANGADPPAKAQVEWLVNSGHHLPFESTDRTTAIITSQTPVQIPVNPGEKVLVKTTAPGFAPSYTEIIANGSALTKPVDIRLTQGVTLDGKLTSSDGSQISSGTITATYWKVNTTNRQGRLGNIIIDFTDIVTSVPVQDGKFQIAHLAPGEYAFDLEADGYGTPLLNFEQPLYAVDDETTTVEVECRRIGYLAGMVTDLRGNPMADVAVECANTEDWRIAWDRTTTDEEGRFRLDGIPDVRWHLHVECFEQATTGTWLEDSRINFDSIHLFSCPPSEKNPRRYSKECMVFDAVTQRPLAGFTAEPKGGGWQQKDMHIAYGPAGSGKFTVHSSSFIGYQLVTVSSPGYLAITQDIQNSEQNPFSLPQIGSLKGHVVSARNGAPVSGAIIRSENWPSVEASTDADGRFLFERFPAGMETRLNVIPRADHLTTSTLVQMEPGGEGFATIVLEPALASRLRLLQDPGDVPVGNEPFEFGNGPLRAPDFQQFAPMRGTGRAALDGAIEAYSGGGDLRVWLPNRQLEIVIPAEKAVSERPLPVRLGSSQMQIQIAPHQVYFDLSTQIDGLQYRYGSDYHRQDYLVATDAAGKGTFRDIPNGTWELRAWKYPGQQRVPGEQAIEMTIQVPPTAELHQNR